jgi:predicted outer membrane protein
MPHQSLGAIFLALVLSSASAATQEVSPSHWPVCAELDAAAMWEIEEAGQTQQISSEKLAAAFFLVMKARRACEEGRLSDAVAIYDDVSFD